MLYVTDSLESVEIYSSEAEEVPFDPESAVLSESLVEGSAIGGTMDFQVDSSNSVSLDYDLNFEGDNFGEMMFNLKLKMVHRPK